VVAEEEEKVPVVVLGVTLKVPAEAVEQVLT
jgi:hypothetical protein